MIHVYDDKDYKNPFRPDGTLRREVDALLKQSTITRSQCIIPTSTNPISKPLPLKTCIPKCTTSSKDRTVRFSPFDEGVNYNKPVDIAQFSLSNGNSNVNLNNQLLVMENKLEAVVQQPVKIEKFSESNYLTVENVNIQVEKCCKIV